MNTPTILQASEVIEDGITKPKILEVWRELAPVNGNPGLFWIGWTRPLASDDFRQLRRFMVCWRTADLDTNGLEGLDEGWRITGEGLDAAAQLGYQVIIDDKHLGTPAVPETVIPLRNSEEPKILRVACELAPIGDNPGLFWIGWARPFTDGDFR